MSVAQDRAAEDSVTTTTTTTTTTVTATSRAAAPLCPTQQSPIFLARQGDASLWLRYRDQDFAIVQASRGMGPRALEIWFQDHSDMVWPDDDDDDNTSDNPTKGIKIRVLSPHYRAYLQNLVLVAKDKESLKQSPSFTITMHAVIQGIPQEDDLASLAEKDCHVNILRSAPSNTAAFLSLVSLTTSSFPVKESKFFRTKLMDAGFPILGKAEGSRSFRGQRLLMAGVRLQVMFENYPTEPTEAAAGAFHENKRVRRSDVVLQDESPVSFATLLDKEERFWQQRHATDNDTTKIQNQTTVAPPRAYQDGHVNFGGINLVVTPAVMIPRPGSLTLVECAERLWREQHPTTPEAKEAPVVLDLGTGSGCLLMALLQSFPFARGYGVDASAEALSVAQTNATRVLGTDRECQFIHGRFSNSECPEKATLVVCNPPYHLPGRLLEAATLQHEPAEALFVGKGCDGLSSYREAWGAVTRLAAPGAVVVLEVYRQNASAV